MADIKQVYPKISNEIEVLENNIAIAEENITEYKKNTQSMEWYGDARDRVEPVIAEICADIVELKKFITDLKEDAGVSAEKMQQTSQENIKTIEGIKG